jgi:hypothetical protein
VTKLINNLLRKIRKERSRIAKAGGCSGQLSNRETTESSRRHGYMQKKK